MNQRNDFVGPVVANAQRDEKVRGNGFPFFLLSCSTVLRVVVVKMMQNSFGAEAMLADVKLSNEAYIKPTTTARQRQRRTKRDQGVMIMIS